MSDDMQEVAIDVDLTGADLTLNERIEVENVCGFVSFEALAEEGRSTFLRAIAWVTAKRGNPLVTLEEAGDLKVRFDE